MLKTRLINKASGLGKDSGKPWCRITLASDKADGPRAIADFWCNQMVANKVAQIPVDSLVYVTAELDEGLHFSVSDVRPVDTAKA